MAEVVRQRQRLGQILVEAQGAAMDRAICATSMAMGQARAVVIAFVRDEDLGLVLQAPERGGMDDAVAVALERVAGGAGRLRDQPPTAFLRPGGDRMARGAATLMARPYAGSPGKSRGCSVIDKAIQLLT